MFSNHVCIQTLKETFMEKWEGQAIVTLIKMTEMLTKQLKPGQRSNEIGSNAMSTYLNFFTDVLSNYKKLKASHQIIHVYPFTPEQLNIK